MTTKPLNQLDRDKLLEEIASKVPTYVQGVNTVLSWVVGMLTDQQLQALNTRLDLTQLPRT